MQNKDHLESLQQHRWLELGDEVRERHRADLLQVLAYSTLSESKAITACLTYPCTVATWANLKKRGTVSHTATVYAGRRKIDIVMLAVPMNDQIDEIVDQISLPAAA
jgi:predicted DNA binding protein